MPKTRCSSSGPCTSTCRTTSSTTSTRAGWLRDHGTTTEQLRFLLPTASGYDAPLDADRIDEPAAPLPAAPPAWFGVAPKSRVALLDEIGDAAVGSNNWAVAGTRAGAGGAAIVANDMHLTLRLPNTWYRAVLELERPGRALRRVVGVTLPGAPAVVAGSNGQVAWGITNSYGSYLDLLELEFDPASATRYRVGSGPAETPPAGACCARSTSRSPRPAAADEILHVQETAFGPLWARGGKRYAVHWVAHDPGAVDLGLARLDDASSVAEALAIGQRAGFPAQNFVVGDAAGHIGWTVAGALPGRTTGWAVDLPRAGGLVSVDRLDRARRAGRPPERGRPGRRRPGDRQRTPAGRAGLRRDRRRRRRPRRAPAPGARRRRRLGTGADETALFNVGLDDRALYLSPWRDRALQALAGDTEAAAHPRRAEFRRLLEGTWTGHASVDSVAYRLTRAFVGSLYAELFGGVDAACIGRRPAGDLRARHGALAGGHRAPARRAAGRLAAAGQRELARGAARRDRRRHRRAREGRHARWPQASWGRRNTRASPIRSPRRCRSACAGWPRRPTCVPGDSHMPRVAAPEFGQSERFVVAPGRESERRLRHAGRPERPSAQRRLPRRPRRLGGRPRDAAAAGRGAAHRCASLPAPQPLKTAVL